MKLLSILLAAVFSGSVMAKSQPGDYLVKISPQVQKSTISALQARLPKGTIVKDLGFNGWAQVQLPQDKAALNGVHILKSMPGVMNIEPNTTMRIAANLGVKNAAEAAAAKAYLNRQHSMGFGDPAPTDNPAIPTSGSGGSGADPLYSKQWGMNQMGVREAWANGKGDASMIVAVIDTGVDYTHEDLVDSLWRNPGEAGALANNGVDDDHNGYIDDTIGWDFAVNDNKPWDMYGTLTDILFSGANPGHGTHCAGNVGAKADNGKGVSGVAGNIRIMALRFLTEKGEGTTAGAVQAVKYAVDNGAKVLSNSWGSEGDDPNDPDTKALKEVIQYAQDHGVLFIAAAGNGHNGAGYNNDTDAKPGVPASYTNDNIISVAAINDQGQLGSFSNWGARSVDLGAPGVKVFSTVTQSEKYTDTLIDFPGMTATWDGTSMACPHVAGAAALYWSQHPGKTWQEVKAAILNSVKRTSVLQGKTVSGGQLDVLNLSKQN